MIEDFFSLWYYFMLLKLKGEMCIMADKKKKSIDVRFYLAIAFFVLLIVCAIKLTLFYINAAEERGLPSTFFLGKNGPARLRAYDSRQGID